MITLSPNMDLTGLFLMIGFVMFFPSILLTIIGFSIKKKNPKATKILFILATVYLIISCGVCGSMLS